MARLFFVRRPLHISQAEPISSRKAIGHWAGISQVLSVRRREIIFLPSRLGIWDLLALQFGLTQQKTSLSFC